MPDDLYPEIAGKRALFFASTGGHLEQLVQIAQRTRHLENSLWITFDNEQSRALIGNRPHLFVDYIASRDFAGVLRQGFGISRRLSWRDYDCAVSTGAALALSGLFASKLHGLPTYYIESVSRFDGPSVSGRILSATRGAKCFTQHSSWESLRWEHRGSVLADYVVSSRAPQPVRRVFVTLGTIHPYRFDSLIDSLQRILPEDAKVTWQIGSTERSDLRGEVHRMVSAQDFDRLAAEADVVVTHAGVGSTLRLLEMGIRPVLVPRSSRRQEHVDDHQYQVTRNLAQRGLVVGAEADELSLDHLVAAQASVIIRTPTV